MGHCHFWYVQHRVHATQKPVTVVIHHLIRTEWLDMWCGHEIYHRSLLGTSHDGANRVIQVCVFVLAPWQVYKDIFVSPDECTLGILWCRRRCMYIYICIYVYIYICSGYKHFTLINEKTSLPLSVRGAYIATTAPYLNIWCLQYFPLIQRRQRNRHTYFHMFYLRY